MDQPRKQIPALRRAHDGKVLNSGLNAATATFEDCNEAVKFLSDNQVEFAHGNGRFWIKAQSTAHAEVFLVRLMHHLQGSFNTMRTITDYASALNGVATQMDSTIPMAGFGVLTRMETLRRIQCGTIAR